MRQTTSKISVLLIFKNNSLLLDSYFDSLRGLKYELIATSNNTDELSVKVVKKYATILQKTKSSNLGINRREQVELANSDWILILDSDERLSSELKQEIKDILNHPDPKINGYRIPYQNHFWNKPLKEEAEQYSKIRLFRRTKGHISPALVHEEITVDGEVGELKGKILHYSYRSIGQILAKFTDYARRAATEKYQAGERVTFKKLFLYGPHMFWARYVKSKGYVDGLEGLLLSKCFAYMEQMTYVFLLYYKIFPPSPKPFTL